VDLLRIGSLGPSRISEPALIDPAASVPEVTVPEVTVPEVTVPEVTVAAVATRDKSRAAGLAPHPKG
jgi:hypothetical protein